MATIYLHVIAMDNNQLYLLNYIFNLCVYYNYKFTGHVSFRLFFIKLGIKWKIKPKIPHCWNTSKNRRMRQNRHP